MYPHALSPGPLATHRTSSFPSLGSSDTHGLCLILLEYRVAWSPDWVRELSCWEGEGWPCRWPLPTRGHYLSPSCDTQTVSGLLQVPYWEALIASAETPARERPSESATLRFYRAPTLYHRGRKDAPSRDGLSLGEDSGFKADGCFFVSFFF